MSTPEFIRSRQRLCELKVSDPILPWRKRLELNCSSILAAGFSPASNQLLIVTEMSQILVDCASGVIVKQMEIDFDSPTTHWDWPGFRLKFESDWFQVAGTNFGGLDRITSDGWSVNIVNLVWPSFDVLLLEPKDRNYSSAARIHYFQSTPIAVGFSENGMHLTVVSCDYVLVYSRME